jgi:hypothetical protein
MNIESGSTPFPGRRDLLGTFIRLSNTISRPIPGLQFH